ncbi:DUF262 domain-containing protein [Knoellia sp. CPCC 206450]|uniref:DUF262 domain-containing protein n=1 Tax=Knoellia tibetensis TaxID=3404798 RepID=UPI003B429EC9
MAQIAASVAPAVRRGSGGNVEATLEPRLVIPGNDGQPFISGDFLVAAYQRGYRWGRHEVRQLLDDIKANADEARKRRATPSDYYLQPVVVLSRGDGVWELVDGQQRLTTLYLLAKYIGTKLPDAKVEYTLSYETRNQAGNDSRHFLENLGTVGDEVRKSNIDFHHIALAYDEIEGWFAEQTNPTKAANDIYNALSEWVYVIWYEAPSDTNPNDLFTRLNRDRIPLTDSELIKALVLSNSGAAAGQPGRQEEIAAQWDGFERDLRDNQFWAFLTGSTTRRPTHIDFLFESMTPAAGLRVRPRYWTFERVRDDIGQRGAAAFWRDVVARHGLLSGWFHDRELYHRIGYLVAIDDSVPDLIEASRSQTHSAFRTGLVDRTRQRLRLSRDEVSLLQYGKHDAKCTEVLLLMNVEAVLASSDSGARFSFHAYARDGWSLEHIHAQNSEGLKKENQRRDWLEAHLKKIRTTQWGDDLQSAAEQISARIDAHLALPAGKTDDIGFQEILDKVFALFGAPGGGASEENLHGLGNLALLQRDFNSKLNNAVFALKRERIVHLDEAGAYILPCTRNVFLKYYTAAEDQQLSIWGPQDQEPYYEKLLAAIDPFLAIEVVAEDEDVA